MHRSVKLIASDLDGTLFGADHQLAERTIRAVHAARQAGIRIVAATGRSTTSAIPRLRPAGVIDTAICSNGALIHDLPGGTTTHRFAIDPAHVDRCIEAVERIDDAIALCWETHEGNGWDAAFAPIARTHDDLGDTPEVNGRPQAHHVTTKLMVHHPSLAQEALRERVVPLLADPLTVACSGVDFVEVTGVGVDKASGLAHLCRAWHIDPVDVLAFGDNQNDVSMLAWAGHGVAMGNGAPAALAAADEVIGSNRDEAVAMYIERLLDERP